MEDGLDVMIRLLNKFLILIMKILNLLMSYSLDRHQCKKMPINSSYDLSISDYLINHTCVY